LPSHPEATQAGIETKAETLDELTGKNTRDQISQAFALNMQTPPRCSYCDMTPLLRDNGHGLNEWQYDHIETCPAFAGKPATPSPKCGCPPGHRPGCLFYTMPALLDDEQRKDLEKGTDEASGVEACICPSIAFGAAVSGHIPEC
ncbi:unnamed protein product, partial [marine sediment metagenome]